MYTFKAQTNKMGDKVVTRIVGEDGDVAIVIAQHHEEVAAWLVRLMNEDCARQEAHAN